MAELLEIIDEHLRRYPQSAMEDLVKLVYQNEFGPGHFITDERQSLTRLEQEVSELQPSSSEVLFEKIGNGLHRLNLRALEDSLALKTVNRIFVLTAQEKQGEQKRFESKLQVLINYYQNEALRAYLSEYKKAGYPPLSHSQHYKEHYAPSYRVVKSDFALYFPVFKQIEALWHKKESLIVAIDGRSGSGKSSLGQLLRDVYGCPVISMDHFFLRPEQRTKERMQEAGGNVDYERFQVEVTKKLQGNEPFRYQIYDCQSNKFSPSSLIQPQPLVVVEGSYSHHPSLVEHYDLKVFLTVPPNIQEKRIRSRNGSIMLQRFKEEWIPLEELYFSSCMIEEQSDIRIDTKHRNYFLGHSGDE